MHGGAVWSKRWEHSMLCRHKQITHGSHLQTTKHFSDKCIIEVNLISSCCSFRETNVTDGEKPSCALCICIRLLWIMFYIINHHFLWHCLRVIWSNWTTEEPAHRTVHNKSFKNPIQVKKIKQSVSILNTLTKTCTCLIHLLPFWVNRQTTQAET